MASAGDIVKVLAPFSEAAPGEYVVQVKNGTTCTLDSGGDFDEVFLEVIGAVPVVPAPKQNLSKVDFIKRFTPDQYANIEAASQTNNLLKFGFVLLFNAEFVSLDDPKTIQLINYCATLGLLSAEDAATILT